MWMVRLGAAILALCLLSGEGLARTCSKSERLGANLVLLQLQWDQRIKHELRTRHTPLGFPVSDVHRESEQLLYQHGFISGHDGYTRTARWVAYRLTRKGLIDAAGRPRIHCFRRDPRLPVEGAAAVADYREPIFDRGHLASDADMKGSRTAQLNSYLMSNIAPQYPCFNRGIWLSLEHLTRAWARRYEAVWVTTGTIFGDHARGGPDELQRMISHNKHARVAIPAAFFRNVVRQSAGGG